MKFPLFLKYTLKKIIFHPLLFAIYPTLFLYNYNKERLTLTLLWLPITAAIICTLILYFIINYFIKNKEKAALITSISIVIILSYNHFSITLVNLASSFVSTFNIRHFISPYRELLTRIVQGSVLILPLVMLYLLHRKITIRQGTLTYVANLISLLLTIPLILNIFLFQATSLKTVKQESNPTVVFSREETYPDIYYLIFDRYAGEETLKEKFDYDNSDFISFLKSKGFFVASSSHTNYSRTRFSLVSSLNMQLLTDMPEISMSGSSSRKVNELLQNNKLQQILKKNGYTYIHFSSNWESTRLNKYADTTINYGLSIDQFTFAVFESSIFYPSLENHLLNKFYRNNIQKTLDHIGKLPFTKQPKFVFAHILAPHPPYFFDKDGNPFTQKQLKQKEEKGNYLDYLAYINGQIKKIVEEILLNSKNPPIIILQADEGPYLFDEFSTLPPQEKKALGIRTGILNAYYAPELDSATLSDSITPVNTFRLIFNAYFGTSYPRLEDKIYYVKTDAHQNATFLDVTNVINH